MLSSESSCSPGYERIVKDDLKAEQDAFQEAFGTEPGKIVGE